MTGPWKRVTFPINVDGMLLTDVDGDGQLDVIGEAVPDVCWLKPLDRKGDNWKIGTIPEGTDWNTQGYMVARLVPEAKDPKSCFPARTVSFISSYLITLSEVTGRGLKSRVKDTTKVWASVTSTAMVYSISAAATARMGRAWLGGRIPGTGPETGRNIPWERRASRWTGMLWRI